MKKLLTFRSSVLFLLIGSVFMLPSMVAEVARAFYPDILPLAYVANSLTLVNSIIALPALAGFVLLGQKVQNKILKYSSIGALLIVGLTILGALYMLVNPTDYIYQNYLLFSFGLLVVEGILFILFGVSLIEAKNKIGRYSMACGILNIIVGVSFTFIITVYLGLLLIPPLWLLEAFILSDAARKYES